MPRNVRNFWFEAGVDGKQEGIATGPRNRDGGLEIDFSQRDKGSVRDVLRIRSYALSDGKLRTEVFDENKNLIHTIVTER